MCTVKFDVKHKTYENTFLNVMGSVQGHLFLKFGFFFCSLTIEFSKSVLHEANKFMTCALLEVL